MTTFDEREQAFEAKFAHDSEMQFKVEARARNLLALWAANQMGKTGEAAVEYAKSLIGEWIKPNPSDAVERVMADLSAAGAAVTAQDAARQFAELRKQAKAQVMSEG